MVAVVGNLDAALDGGLQDGLALLDRDRPAVNRQRDGFHKLINHSGLPPERQVLAIARPFDLEWGLSPANLTQQGRPYGRASLRQRSGSLRSSNGCSRRRSSRASSRVGVADRAASCAPRPLPPRSAPVARPLVASVPAAVPARAVSVPVLPFLDGKEVRVGDSVSAVATDARPRGGGRPAGSRPRQPRRAADPLLRVRRRPLHPGVRAVRAERRSRGGGDLPAVSRPASARPSSSCLRSNTASDCSWFTDQLAQRAGQRQRAGHASAPSPGWSARSVLPPA